MINHQQNRHHYQILDTRHLKPGTIFHRKNICKLRPPQRQYLGCFCKDQMDNLSKSIRINMNQDPNPRIFTLINTENLASNSEHWMGIVMNKLTNCGRFFDSFSRTFDWLENMLHKHFNKVHKTNHKVQSESTQTCGLHTIYFIVCMMNPKDTTNMTRTINVGQYVRCHYDTKSNDATLKDEYIVDHLSKKFKTNFNMLLP